MMSREQQRQLDRILAENERRVATLNALVALEKRVALAEEALDQVKKWNGAEMFDGDDFLTLDRILSDYDEAKEAL